MGDHTYPQLMGVTPSSKGQMQSSLLYDVDTINARDQVNNSGIYRSSKDKAVHMIPVGAVTMAKKSTNKGATIQRVVGNVNDEGAQALAKAKAMGLGTDYAVELLKNEYMLGPVNQQLILPESKESKVKQKCVTGGPVPVYLDDPTAEVGDLLVGDFPDPLQDPGTYNHYRLPSGAHEEAYPFITKRFDPSDFVHFLATDLKALLDDKNTALWLDAMGRSLPSTHSRGNAAAAIAKRDLFNGVLTIWKMISMNNPLFTPVGIPEFTERGTPLPSNVIAMRICLYMGIIQGDRNDPAVQAAEKALNDSGRKGFWKTLARDLVKTYHYTGENRNYEFGMGLDGRGNFSRQTKDTTRDNSGSLANNVFGKMVERQINNTPLFLGALGDYWKRHSSFVLGRLVQKPPGDQPGVCTVVMGFTV